MANQLGKWEQMELLKMNELTMKHIPETNIYSLENLLEFTNRYKYVYVKHNSSGQGRGIFKVFKQDGLICYNGFSIQAEPINNCVTEKRIKEFHQTLHPFEKLGRLGNYIVQEGIQSFSSSGLPFCLRVHVQKLEGKWIIGGMNAKIGTPATIDSGILNYHRGSQVITVEELLTLHLKMDQAKKKEVMDCLAKVALSAAEVISSHFPCREYGIDFGLDPNGKPVLFEINTTPGINGFAQIENKAIWKRIIEIRKLQNKEFNIRND
ncbi:YheC/YheD family protein [Bacillus sp. FJAT-49736]|uniref:YheC/YheD family protein n=1 Tax=Bacillus sp. FJAT-49736 TaxID=2833582 RepID=UPI001BC9613F|nr:YheC/YheD family protein [Bacillus sp. FJAT-49736]